MIREEKIHSAKNIRVPYSSNLCTVMASARFINTDKNKTVFCRFVTARPCFDRGVCFERTISLPNASRVSTVQVVIYLY